MEIMEAGRQTAPLQVHPTVPLQAHPTVRLQVHPIARQQVHPTVCRITDLLRQHALLHRPLIVLHRAILPGPQEEEEAVA